MLLTLVDVLACENPKCRHFAKFATQAHGERTYYCQTCGKISRARCVDAALAASPQKYEEYMRKLQILDAEQKMEIAQV